MLTRIRLRRTESSIDSFNNASIEDHKLRYGEALYSIRDNALVIGGKDSTKTISQIENRFFAIGKVGKNLVYAGPSSGSNVYPTFRALTASDIPTLPASKVTGISSYAAGKGIYFTGSSPIRINVGDSDGGALDLSVGGTNSTSYEKNSVIVGSNDTLPNGNALKFSYIKSRKGAFYSTGTDAIPQFGTLPVANGGTGIVVNPSLLVNLSSSVAVNIFTSTPRPGITGTLPVANGGTGKSSWTTNGIIYAASSNSFGQITPKANSVLMSDASMKPSWKSSNDIIANVDWANLEAWKNIYIWEHITRNTGFSTAGTESPLNLKFIDKSVSISDVSEAIPREDIVITSPSIISCYTTFKQISRNSISLSGRSQITGIYNNIYRDNNTNTNLLYIDYNDIEHSGNSLSAVLVTRVITIPANSYFILDNRSSSISVDLNPTAPSYVRIFKNKTNSELNLYGFISWTPASLHELIPYTVSYQLSTSSSSIQIDTSKVGEITLETLGIWYDYSQPTVEYVSESVHSSYLSKHGINSSNTEIWLYRGTFYNMIFHKYEYNSYVGNGNKLLTINLFDLFGCIPYSFVVGEVNKITSLGEGENYGGFGVISIGDNIDITKLYRGSPSNPSPSPHYWDGESQKPDLHSNPTLFQSGFKLWHDKSCKSIDIWLYADGTEHENTISQFNKSGQRYQIRVGW